MVLGDGGKNLFERCNASSFEQREKNVWQPGDDMTLRFLKRLLTFRFRKRPRFHARDGVFVIMENSVRKNQVQNISMGGLAFDYEDSGYLLGKGSYELKVLADKNLTLDRIPFKKVSDFAVGEVLYPYRKIKRQTVQFARLDKRPESPTQTFNQKQHHRQGLNNGSIKLQIVVFGVGNSLHLRLIFHGKHCFFSQNNPHPDSRHPARQLVSGWSSNAPIATGKPWYTAYLSIPGLLILLTILVVPIVLWLVSH